MAQPLFVLNIDGHEEVVRGFSRFTQGLKDLRPAWPGVAVAFRKAMHEQFRTEGEHGGNRWEPLSPGYAAWKESQHPGLPLLVLTGQLRGSLIDKTGESIEESRPMSLTLGTRVPYSGFHQRGTRKMPARPLIVLAEDDKRAMTRAIQEYLVDRARREHLID